MSEERVIHEYESTEYPRSSPISLPNEQQFDPNGHITGTARRALHIPAGRPIPLFSLTNIFLHVIRCFFVDVLFKLNRLFSCLLLRLLTGAKLNCVF